MKKNQNKFKGPSLWKFDTSLLTDEAYTNEMKESIIKWINEYGDIGDSRIKWELIKYEIRKLTIRYSKEKKRNTNILQKQLEKELIDLERNLDNSKMERYSEVKRELQDIEDNKIKGYIVRSKIQEFEEGEKVPNSF